MQTGGPRRGGGLSKVTDFRVTSNLSPPLSQGAECPPHSAPTAKARTSPWRHPLPESLVGHLQVLFPGAPPTTLAAGPWPSLGDALASWMLSQPLHTASRGPSRIPLRLPHSCSSNPHWLPITVGCKPLSTKAQPCSPLFTYYHVSVSPAPTTPVTQAFLSSNR